MPTCARAVCTHGRAHQRVRGTAPEPAHARAGVGRVWSPGAPRAAARGGLLDSGSCSESWSTVRAEQESRIVLRSCASAVRVRAFRRKWITARRARLRQRVSLCAYYHNASGHRHASSRALRGGKGQSWRPRLTHFINLAVITFLIDDGRSAGSKDMAASDNHGVGRIPPGGGRASGVLPRDT